MYKQHRSRTKKSLVRRIYVYVVKFARREIRMVLRTRGMCVEISYLRLT